MCVCGICLFLRNVFCFQKVLEKKNVGLISLDVPGRSVKKKDKKKKRLTHGIHPKVFFHHPPLPPKNLTSSGLLAHLGLVKVLPDLTLNENKNRIIIQPIKFKARL